MTVILKEVYYVPWLKDTDEGVFPNGCSLHVPERFFEREINEEQIYNRFKLEGEDNSIINLNQIKRRYVSETCLRNRIYDEFLKSGTGLRLKQKELEEKLEKGDILLVANKNLLE